MFYRTPHIQLFIS